MSVSAKKFVVDYLSHFFEDEKLTLADRAAIVRDKLGNKRQRKQAKNYLTKAAEKETGPKTFARKGVVAEPAREKYLTTPKEFMAMGGSGKEIKHSEPVDSTHAVIKHTMKRSANTGRSYVDKERIEVKPEKTRPSHITGVQPEIVEPSVRVDLPGKAGPHVANAVTKALIKATTDPYKKNLLARQAAVKKSDEEV